MPQTTSKSKAAGTKKKKRRKKRRSKQRQSHTAALLAVGLLLAVVLVLALRAAFHLGSRHAEPAPAPTPSPSVEAALPASTLSRECFGRQDGYITYESPEFTAAMGVDLSSYQEWIDWQALSESNVDFAIIRAGFRGYGDGSTRQDEYFTFNMESAAACGMPVGVYFFSQALNEEEARAEAHEVLAMIQDYDIQYPVYFDWEPIDEAEARTDTISATELTACAKAFCETVEAAGYRAGVYFNLTMAAHYYHLPELGDYSFWLAEYQDAPSLPFAIDMWQYTSSGTVPGVDGNVDLNLSFLRD